MDMRFGVLVAALLVVFPASANRLTDRLIERELKKAVSAAEKEALADSADRADCSGRPKIWRAPISSLTQEIQIKRCDIVYYYTAGYSPVGGEFVPVSFEASTYFDGTENLTTGEFTGTIVPSPERAR